jgi:hypothetical protein
LFSKILLFALLVLLASKFGLFTRFKRLKPRLDRAVNLTIIGLGVIYVGHLLWWFVNTSRGAETKSPAGAASRQPAAPR